MVLCQPGRRGRLQTTLAVPQTNLYHPAVRLGVCHPGPFHPFHHRCLSAAHKIHKACKNASCQHHKPWQAMVLFFPYCNGWMRKFSCPNFVQTMMHGRAKSCPKSDSARKSKHQRQRQQRRWLNNVAFLAVPRQHGKNHVFILK